MAEGNQNIWEALENLLSPSSTSLDETQDFFRTRTSSSLDYFTKQYLSQTPAQRAAYLEGWQLNPKDINYNMPLAFLTSTQPARQPEDVGPAGPRWHFPDMSPGGQHLKAPWHPAYWWEDFTTLQNKFQELLRKR